MKTNFTKLLFFTCVLLISTLSQGQNYVGFSADNYNGVHGVIFNPSSVVDSRFRSDINLLSISTFLGSDYFSLDLSTALDAKDGFTIEGNSNKNARENNNFFLNTDVLGPSFMFNINRRNSVAITSRLRAFFNLNNIDGMFYEYLTNDFNQSENLDFQINNMSGTMHVWSELGLTYGRILIEKDHNFLKGGVSVKYLQGAGGLFASAPLISGDYNAETAMLTTTGNVRYGATPGFDNDDIDFSDLSSGIGLDLGFTYEYRPEIYQDTISKKLNKYKFKVGVSVTDLGNISYDNSSQTSYNLNNSVNTDTFENNDTETILAENYEGSEEIITAKINLPTALNLLADYQIRKRLYISVQGSLSLIPADKDMANRIVNTVTAAPRLETRWLSLYLPLSMRQYDGFSMGAGLRFGPVMVGSGSVISNLIGNSSKTTDIYAGLKIPIYQ